MTTDQLFTRNGIKLLQEKIGSGDNKKVVVIGSSHSALSSLSILLKKLKNVSFENSGIVLLYRNAPKLFYQSAEEARTDGYREFTEYDICPLTGKVHRLAGLRLDSRELFRSISGMTQKKENSVRLCKIDSIDERELTRLLEESAVIIPAFGYRPAVIPLFDESGRPIELSATKDGPLVDRNCRVMDSCGNALPGLFGIGLASGFVPWGKLGGEPGFRGQTNGLWLYQNGVGEMILDQLLDEHSPETTQKPIRKPN
jgi:hypothetical protein